MSLLTFSTLRPRYVSSKRMLSGLRLLDLRRVANYAVSFIVALSLLLSSTPAAAQTIVSVSKQQKASLAFWLRANNFPAIFYKALLGQSARPNAQEKQNARDTKVRSIGIHPGDVTIRVEERINFAAVAYDEDGNAIGGVRMKWSARDDGRNHSVRLSQRGDFESIAPGNFKVTVEGAGKKAQVKITVVDGPRRSKKGPPLSTTPVSTRDLPLGAASRNTKKQGKRYSAHAQKGTSTRLSSVGLKTSSTTAAMLLPNEGWGSDNYWSADDPGNRRGDLPGHPLDSGAGSGNFEFTAPVLALPGRGIDIGLGLTYNARLWNKAGSLINFDIDRDWPAPGFSLGFGKIIDMGSGGSMIVDGNGTRHSFSGTVTTYSYGQHFTGYTTDGSLINYSTWKNSSGVMTWGEVNLPTGTQLHYYCSGPGGVFPTQIMDANGNYITIVYVNNAGPRIQTVVDTLGRLIDFHYDGYNFLTAISTPGLGGGTRTLVRLQYRQLALSYSFSGLTPVVRDYGYPWVVNAIYYPGTNNGYWFGDTDSYSTYGMLAKVSERRNMVFSAGSLNEQGTITSAGAITREQIYNYPLSTGSPGGSYLTDAPTYSSLTETWTRDGWVTDQAVTNYEVYQNSYPRTVTITLPNGSKSKQFSYNSPGSFLDGLVYQDQTLNAANTVLQSSLVTWAPGAYNSARPARVEATNERGLMTATEFSYGASYNQVTEVRNYDYGGATLLRSTRVQYQNSSNYTTSRHIFNLPLVVEVFAGDNVTRVSRTEYQYDGQTLLDTPDVVMHADNHNPYAPEYLVEYCAEYDYEYGGCLQWNSYWTSDYNPITDYRGNVTQATSYANAGTEPASAPLTETRRYDINGNMVKTSSSCCEQTSFNYPLATQYAYPLSQTRGSATDAYAQVTTSATYDFNTGVALSATDANGRTSQTVCDVGTLRPLTATLPTGAHTDYSYDDAGLTVSETSYLESHPTHTTIASQKIRLLNGLGQVRQEKTMGANGVWDLVDTNYDNMGRVSQQSLPYRSGTPLWSTTTYDALGRVDSVQAPDTSLMQAFYNELNQPSAATTLPGETRRLVDGWGRERWGRADARGKLVEVVEPDPGGGGSVASNGMRTTYTYTTQGDLTGVVQGSQSRAFKYDSVGRLTAQKLAEVNPTLNDAGTYVGTGQWGDIFTYDDRSNMTSAVDARGIRTVFTYNNDPLNRLQSVSWDTSGFSDTANPILPAASISYQYRTKSSGSQLIDITHLSSVTTAGVSTESFGFDAEGRINSKTFTLTNRSSFPFVTDYIYDSMDRVTDVRYPAEYGNGAQPRKLLHHNYDVASRLSGLTLDSQSHASQFVYNAASQTEQLKVGLSGANQITETYGYHAQTGLLASQTVVRGVSTTLLNLSYDYEGANGKRTGQLTKISNNLDQNKDRGYEYDALGRLRRATGGQNVNWAQRYNYDRYGNRQNVFSYTAENYVRNFYQSAFNRQPTSNELQTALGTLQSAYAQGPSQFLTAMQNLGNSLFTNQEYINRNRSNSEYVYDLYKAYLYRVPDQGGWDFWTGQVASNGRDAVRAGFAGSLEFNLKVSGNSPYSPPSGTVPRDGWEAMSYDQATNRVNVSGWGYDAAGNQTRAQNGAGWQRFQYDAANRLVKVKADDNVTVLGSYTYGSSNERLGREEAGLRTYYAWSGSEVVAEYTESGGSTTPAWSKSYVYLGRRLLSTLTPNGGGGAAVEYHHADRLGTRQVTNAQNTSSFEQVTLPFGTAQGNESTGATNRRFSSYDRSATTGIDYAVNRHYDSQQGRFTQVDPIGMAAVGLGNPQSLNLYAYCMNDPVNHIDPSGLGFLSFFKKLFKVISKILMIIAIVAAVAFVMTLFPGSAAAVGKFILGIIGKIMSYLGPLKFAANGITGEVGISGVNPLGVAFSAIFTVGAVANQLQCGGKCRPKEITGANPAQLVLITDAIDDLIKRIENNKECAKVLGGKDKALKAIRESTVLVAPIDATVILGPGGRPLYERVLRAQTNNKKKTIHLGSNTVLAPDGKMTIRVMGGPPGTLPTQTIQGTVPDINEISATLAHETAHRTNSKEIVQKDDDQSINDENDDKVRKACGY